MKIPGPETPQTGTLLTNAKAVNPDWYPCGALATKIKPRPDWDKHLNVPDLEVWQAIALSLNIEPAYNPQGIDTDFDKRMVIVLRHMTSPNGLLKHIEMAKRAHTTRVRLSDIVHLAAYCTPAWHLPPEFPAVQVEALPAASLAPEIQAAPAIHKIQTRSHKLSAEIKEALRRAGSNSGDIHVVWSELAKMAVEKWGCLLEHSDLEDVKYGYLLEPSFFSKDSLKKRMARIKAGKAR